MRKAYRKPTITSERSFETSALSCAKTAAGDVFHFGPGSTYLSGHAAASTNYSHTPGTGGNWLHVNPGFSSATSPICNLAYMAS